MPVEITRREWDSNPRGTYIPRRLAGVRNRPLCDLAMKPDFEDVRETYPGHWLPSLAIACSRWDSNPEPPA